MLLAAAVLTIIGMQFPANAINIKNIHIRDPFILTDSATSTYYMYASRSVKDSSGKNVGGVAAYTSKDLKEWNGPVQVFTAPADNWTTGGVWAPEVHEYNGKYYLFATLNDPTVWKAQRPGWAAYTHRGTQIFRADSPAGPFLPMGNLPHTPIDQMGLDGTLWVEDGQPYMVYCHEWVETEDGGMNLIKLTPDLSSTEGRDFLLFNASAAPWSTGALHKECNAKSYVTDGCFLYRTKTGRLLMIWSSFFNDDYALGIAESTTGRITGPWRQQPDPVFTKNGGHGMIFKDLKGNLVLVLHGPNTPAGAERARLFLLRDTGDTLQIEKEITGR